MANHAQFFKLIQQLPEAKKEEIVWSYSNGATESLSAFLRDDPNGYTLMIKELNKRVQMEIDRETKRLRSAILTRLQKYGIDTSDWHEVNRFLELPIVIEKTKINEEKRVNEITKEERRNLVKVLKKFELTIKDFRPVEEATLS